ARAACTVKSGAGVPTSKAACAPPAPASRDKPKEKAAIACFMPLPPYVCAAPASSVIRTDMKAQGLVFRSRSGMNDAAPQQDKHIMGCIMAGQTASSNQPGGLAQQGKQGLA